MVFADTPVPRSCRVRGPGVPSPEPGQIGGLAAALLGEADIGPAGVATGARPGGLTVTYDEDQGRVHAPILPDSSGPIRPVGDA